MNRLSEESKHMPFGLLRPERITVHVVPLEELEGNIITLSVPDP